ncbi:hypothetical protein [Streptomyces sp. ME18-1-4]|uniref:hypothetical protein n=1 Tax=Streptomyces sp. ME18-1-4 TaxID=3028685 RepID=UPI0029BE535B|nr:hypothetical protein [Streptomyces sp. ME18-1-4]MDX3242481.1 hypothetical protein [Streptomyces sp. ME18-1-4]
MTQPAASCNTAEEARDFLQANGSGGPILILAPDVLEQIQAAEGAGGHEGGMSGADGTSREGNPGPNTSDGSELPPLDFDIEGAVTGEGIMRFVEGVIEVAHTVGEAAHWIAEGGVTPILVVPREVFKELVPDGA